MTGPKDRRRRHLQLVEVGGNPTEEERRALRAALEQLVEDERWRSSLSVWRRVSRAQGRRLGNTDYRDRFSHEDAWRLSARLPFGGREYPGRAGRGDSR
ncbi:MAG TPA: hypothetical protein VM573_01700 [Actinomycetota bacterium]|nr:hypothetical protein [Actinomycetota bacterium]